MASGYGLTGGVSRCFPWWQEVVACYVVNTSSPEAAGPAKCKPILDDYYECLHHKKEKKRVLAMQAAYNRHLQQNNEQRYSQQEIKTLGLIPNQKPEDVHIKTSKVLPHRAPGNS